MNVNLSIETIRKVTEISFARVNELKRKIADNEKPVTQRKRIYFYNLNKALEDAKDIHDIFLQLLEDAENE